MGIIDPRVQRGTTYRGLSGENFEDTPNLAMNTSILAPENRGAIDNVYIIDLPDTEVGGITRGIGDSTGFLLRDTRKGGLIEGADIYRRLQVTYRES